MTATLIPPSIAIVSNLVEAVLSAQQGVKCVSLGYAAQGNRVQDIAAIRVMADVSREVLANMGYEDVAVHTVFHQYMAAFPPNEQRAEELIFGSSVTAGDYLLVESDVLRVSRELYRTWPLDSVTADPIFVSLPTGVDPAVCALPGER